MDPSIASSLRDRLRRPGDALADAPIGTVPILWNNVDLADLRLGAGPETVLDEIARTGYEGTQLGLGFPEGESLQALLETRDLRLAEVYVAIPTTTDGPAAGAQADARERLRLLHEAGGDVLCLALDGSPERAIAAGRTTAAGPPGLSETGWRGLVDLLHTIARETLAAGHRAVFHPHAGTFVETPDEVDRLVTMTDETVLGICLDVGHFLVGGGNPAAAIGSLGARVTHVHLKDVDPVVLSRLRSGEIDDFNAAIRARIFTELGAGVLDLDGVLAALIEHDYRGWLMVEQDSSWGPPSESAAIGRRVLAMALRRLGQERAA